MPTYNGAKFLHRSVNSILSQTHQNFEFIIVDDGSTDNTREIIDSFCDSRIVYIHQMNKGPVFAYNRGFKEAKGEYIFIQDHDDYSFPDRIEKQIIYMEQNDCDLVASWYYIKHLRTGYIEEVNKNYTDADIKKILLFKPWVIHNPTVCIKKGVFEKYGYFNETLRTSFDYEFYLRIRNNIVFGIVPAFIYKWSHGRTSYGASKAFLCRESFRKIALESIKIEKPLMGKHQYYSIMGLLNYYSDHLLLSIYYLLIATLLKLNKHVVKYLIATTFGGLFIKIARRYYLLDMWPIRNVKKIFIGI